MLPSPEDPASSAPVDVLCSLKSEHDVSQHFTWTPASDAPFCDGQFSLRLINVNETPVCLERATRVVDCEVTHLPVVEHDLPVPVLATITTPASGSPTPTIPNVATNVFPSPSVEIPEGNDIGTGHSVFSTIDLQQGFFQVPLDPDSREKTAFSTPHGHFQFKRMPFGLRNSPITFSRLMAAVMTGLIGNTRQIDYLGHTIDSNGLTPNSRKIDDILDYPQPKDVKQSSTLATDASTLGLGAALMQKTNGRLRPIAFASRKLNSAETRYSATDLESLAVVWALKHFRELILGYDIEVLTDHRPLCHLLAESKSPSGRQARWIDTLLEFNPVIRYTPGASNKVADSLSRIPVSHLDVLDADDLRTKQREDVLYKDLIQSLEKDPSRPLPPRRYVPTRDLYLQDGILFRRSAPASRAVDNAIFTNSSLYPSHSYPRYCSFYMKHPQQPMRALTRRFHFGTCLLTYDIPERPSSVLVLTFFSGLLLPLQITAIYHHIDNFSRYCELIPIPDKPQANGITERLNHTILNMLRATLNTHSLDWDEWIPIIQMAINSTYHSTLGDIPHFILYGEDRRLPYELIEQNLLYTQMTL
ncbi:uncharacterized protein LOC122254087 [Penaeus japonicus]|uniref:uncharacterized protein LOC122254087 n=1 Tax=Penaeus japonicus TaxID=27405 RepID=UPI001C714071|nr:uncharacterized protein LOC122254087 [Penaeus japonicus]